MGKDKKNQGPISTDVLIIGGGIGGLTAAMRVKELSPESEVLMVDKQSIGWGGKTNKGAGVLWVLAPEHDVDQFMGFHVNAIGEHLNDQELLRKMAEESYPAVNKLSEWGASVMKKPSGELDLIPMPMGWALAGIDLDAMRPLRKTARKMGIRMMDKVHVVELLKQGDRVTGAVGFSLVDSHIETFQAKAVILANGDCDYGVMRMWASATGDGVVAAYNAGAEMRNAEFGNFYDVCDKATTIPYVFGFNFLYNAKGENITQKYVKGPQPDVPISILLGMEKEIADGNGPIYIELPEREGEGGGFSAWDRPVSKAFMRIETEKTDRYMPESDTQKREVSLGFTGELSAIKVDHDMKTTVPGLWAIGDASYAGSAWAGATEAPPGRLRGSGIMNAVLAGLFLGPSVSAYLNEAEAPVIDMEEAERMSKEILSPLDKQSGYTPKEAIHAIQEVVVPVKYSMRRNEQRLNEALEKIGAVQSRLPELSAVDAHGLSKCHDARCMAVCAEMGFTAALARKESRGWHYREDYPERDDVNWLKWVILKKEDEKMTVSTEPIPIDKYKFKPGDKRMEPPKLETVPDAVVEHEELLGVTPEMIDWWWVNMEKGYPLWEPNDHKSFVWEVPPPVGGYLGAIQVVEESMGEGMPAQTIRIRWDNPDEGPIPVEYEHAILCAGISPDGKPGAFILHEYEATDKGTKMRSTMRFPGPVPPEFPEIWKDHDRREVGCFPNFLPDFHRLWQTVSDPKINRQCTLMRAKTG